MAQRASRPKNVLFIWTDQQRPDTIGAYRGSSGVPGPDTPNVDRLAAGGALFEQAYCTQPVCSPSRASVLTGLYPHAHGVPQNNIPLAAEIPTLAELLRPHGYATGYVGKWHLGNELGRPELGTHGFDSWVSTEDQYTRDRAAEGFSDYYHFLVSRGYEPPDTAADGAKVFSRPTAAKLPEEVGKPAFQAGACVDFLERNRDRPFLLMVNFLEPHPPYIGPFDDRYDPERVPLPESWYRAMEPSVPARYRQRRREYEVRLPQVDTNDERGWKALKARYWGSCTLVDKYVGKILDRLEVLGLADDTVVVYSTDHGDMMGEHRLIQKSVPYEGATHVPLIVRAPGVEAAQGRRLATPVSQVHLVPTLLDLLGQPVPGHVQGTSLVPLLAEGDRAPEEAEVVIEWNGRPRQVSGSGDVSEAKPSEVVDVRTIRRGRWKLNAHLTGEVELYDLRADPGELHNAVADAGSGAVVRDLFERLRAWQGETADPATLPQPALAQ